MSHAAWSIFLFAAGIILLIAEFILPAHGLVCLIGVMCILSGVGFCFLINSWLGAGVFVAAALASPFLFTLAIRLFPRTLLGRKLVLPPVENPVPGIPVQIGQVGLAISELRPMGICEFDGQRVEAASEYGIVPAGAKVQVVTLNNRQPVVRVV
jgi:membrane-bound serine protease (ClpP class)